MLMLCRHNGRPRKPGARSTARYNRTRPMLSRPVLDSQVEGQQQEVIICSLHQQQCWRATDTDSEA